MSFSSYKPRKKTKRKILLGIAIFVILVPLLTIASVYALYQSDLQAVSGQHTSHVVTIEQGATPKLIAAELQSKGAIKSSWAFELYVRRHNLGDQLKAGTYAVYENQSVEDITKVLISGKVVTQLVTILPGNRIDQVKQSLIKSGFTEADVNAALDPSMYAGHPALVGKPAGASLEGYLYPESFEKTDTTTAQQVVKQSLDEMQKHLTAARIQAFADQGLTPYQGIIVASIVEKEVSNIADRPQVAQVFLKRYKINMMLGSDVTAFYGAIMADQEPSVAYDTPYNTRIHTGLPPGPISNVSESSLEAVAHPAATDWLFFVAGDDGKTYFSKTNEEHEALVKKYCTKLCN